MKNSNIQAPTSKETPSLKVQSSVRATSFEYWWLELLWSLDVGAWSFSSRLAINCFVSKFP